LGGHSIVHMYRSHVHRSHGRIHAHRGRRLGIHRAHLQAFLRVPLHGLLGRTRGTGGQALAILEGINGRVGEITKFIGIFQAHRIFAAAEAEAIVAAVRGGRGHHTTTQLQAAKHVVGGAAVGTSVVRGVLVKILDLYLVLHTAARAHVGEVGLHTILMNLDICSFLELGPAAEIEVADTWQGNTAQKADALGEVSVFPPCRITDLGMVDDGDLVGVGGLRGVQRLGHGVLLVVCANL